MDLPEPTPESARDFCLRLIEDTSDLALAFKPNAAFFEAFGPKGYSVLGEVIAAIPSNILVILDAKRGDIASSSQAYAQAAFQALGAHAVTVNPYLGYDAIEPFLVDPERGVFLLCKTSNPGAADLQDLEIIAGPGFGTLRLYEYVAGLAQRWNTHDNLGLVVGATHRQALQIARRLAPDLWILAPGVGSQGGDLRAALFAGLRQDGSGLLIPVSRSLSRAASPRRAAEELRRAINQAREEIRESRVVEGLLSNLASPLSILAALPSPQACSTQAASNSADSPSNPGCNRRSTSICGVWLAIPACCPRWRLPTCLSCASFPSTAWRRSHMQLSPSPQPSACWETGR